MRQVFEYGRVKLPILATEIAGVRIGGIKLRSYPLGENCDIVFDQCVN